MILVQANRGFSYSISHSVLNSSHSRHEQRDEDGVVRGVYRIKSPLGNFREVKYVADSRGFRAQIVSNEPGLTASNPANVAIRKTNVPERPSLREVHQDISRASAVDGDHSSEVQAVRATTRLPNGDHVERKISSDLFLQDGVRHVAPSEAAIHDASVYSRRGATNQLSGASGHLWRIWPYAFFLKIPNENLHQLQPLVYYPGHQGSTLQATWPSLVQIPQNNALDHNVAHAVMRKPTYNAYSAGTAGHAPCDAHVNERSPEKSISENSRGSQTDELIIEGDPGDRMATSGLPNYSNYAHSDLNTSSDVYLIQSIFARRLSSTPNTGSIYPPQLLPHMHEKFSLPREVNSLPTINGQMGRGQGHAVDSLQPVGRIPLLLPAKRGFGLQNQRGRNTIPGHAGPGSHEMRPVVDSAVRQRDEALLNPHWSYESSKFNNQNTALRAEHRTENKMSKIISRNFVDGNIVSTEVLAFPDQIPGEERSPQIENTDTSVSPLRSTSSAMETGHPPVKSSKGNTFDSPTNPISPFQRTSLSPSPRPHRLFEIPQMNRPLYNSRGDPVKPEDVPVHLHRFVPPPSSHGFSESWKFSIPRPVPPRSIDVAPNPSSVLRTR